MTVSYLHIYIFSIGRTAAHAATVHGVCVVASEHLGNLLGICYN